MARRGRPPDPKLRDRLLDAAIALFLKQGFAGTSVDAICRRAEVSKGAVFHLFPDKATLVRAALERWVRGGRAMYAHGPFHAETDPARRAMAYVEFTAALAAHEQAPLGCLIGLACAELALDDAHVRDDCHGALQQWARELAALLVEARPRGADWNPAEVARHFVVVFEGAQLLARADADRAVVARHLALFRDWLETLLQPRRKP